MKNEAEILRLLAETHCPSEADLPEFEKCEGEKDCLECWKEAVKEES